MNIKLAHIIAARPNFIKAAPLIKELSDENYKNIIIHTNQHYDYKMSKIFFQELNIPEPDYHLGIKSGTHAEQTGRGLMSIEKVLLKEKPKALIVYGDVNSTLAGALAAVKLHIPVFHVESGCRSFDKTMPEEVNRIMIDSISDLLFCTEQSAYDNLISEGFSKDKIKLVGNTAIDSLNKITLDKFIDEDYYLCTLHRPYNVDDKNTLHKILTKLDKLGKKVIIPAHPRLKNNLTGNVYNNIKFIEPLGYIDFISYLKHSKGAVSDSGGIQCEASFLNVPLLTLRPTTEHLVTLERGNTLTDIDKDFIFNKNKYSDVPFIWDGNASKRIVNEIKKINL